LAWAAEGRGVARGRAAVQIHPAKAVRNLGVVLFRRRLSSGREIEGKTMPEADKNYCTQKVSPREEIVL